MTKTKTVRSVLTPAQRQFWDSNNAGVRSLISRKLRTFGGNTADFKKWFNRYKNN